jgi:hypothetical protein
MESTGMYETSPAGWEVLALRRFVAVKGICILLLLALPCAMRGAEEGSGLKTEGPSIAELKQFSLPELMEMKIRSAARSLETVLKSPAWQWGRHTEIAIVGQNLLDDQHPEFRPGTLGGGTAAEIERGVYGKITWRF